MAPAFVLNDDALSGGPVVFPGFPGVWTPGEPVEAQAFVDAGSFASIAEMRDLVDELGLPLAEVQVDEGSAPLPARDNHMANAEEAREAGEKALADMSHTELDRLGADHDGYPKSAAKADKVAFLEAILSEETVEGLGVETTAGEEG